MNVRGIFRAMAYEGVFERQFELVTDKAFSIGVRGAMVEGCTFGVASTLLRHCYSTSVRCSLREERTPTPIWWKS